MRHLHQAISEVESACEKDGYDSDCATKDGALAASLEVLRDSWPSHDAGGGRFFDFGAVRTEFDRDAPAQAASPSRSRRPTSPSTTERWTASRTP